MGVDLELIFPAAFMEFHIVLGYTCIHFVVCPQFCHLVSGKACMVQGNVLCLGLGDGGIVFFYDETLITDQATVMTVRMDDGIVNGKFTNLEVDE